MKKLLTITELNAEYIKWLSMYGNSRNESDLRFGQFIHIEYALPVNTNYSVNDGFSTEDINKAYENISNLITKNK